MLRDVHSVSFCNKLFQNYETLLLLSEKMLKISGKKPGWGKGISTKLIQ